MLVENLELKGQDFVRKVCQESLDLVQRGGEQYIDVDLKNQAFVAQWSPRLVLAILALLRGQTIEEVIFDVDDPWASVGHQGSREQALYPYARRPKARLSNT